MDLVVENCSLATMEGPQYGAVEDGVVAVHQGRIAWAGARKDAPSFTAVDRIDGGA